MDVSEPQANVSAEEQRDKGEGEGNHGGAGDGENKTEEQNNQIGEQHREAETATDPRRDGKDTQTDSQNSNPEQAKL